MTEKEKAAPQNGTTPITHTDVTTAPTSAATKLELVALHLVENGTNGISSRGTPRIRPIYAQPFPTSTA